MVTGLGVSTTHDFPTRFSMIGLLTASALVVCYMVGISTKGRDIGLCKIGELFEESVHPVHVRSPGSQCRFVCLEIGLKHLGQLEEGVGLR